MDNVVEKLFYNKSPVVMEIYQVLLERINQIGKTIIEPKQTSIHIKSRGGFAGIHPKKNWLDFNLVLNREIKHPKLTKTEWVSKNRTHNTFRFHNVEEISDDFQKLLLESYNLMNS